jgi:V-type H+-transporting ATPase subunit H
LVGSISGRDLHYATNKTAITTTTSSTTERDIDIHEFFRWMTFQLQSPQQHVIDLNIQILDALFHIPKYRRAFWNTSHAIESLVNILKKSTAPQKIYELTFAIWLLSFDTEVAKNLDRKCQIILTLVELAKAAVKEKVIRVIIATIRVGIE